MISVGTRREEEDPIATMKILLERIDLRTRREERVEKKWVAPRGAMKGRSVINARYIRQRFGERYIYIYLGGRIQLSFSLFSNLYIEREHHHDRNKQKRRVNNGEHRTLSRMVVIVPAAGTYRSKCAPAAMGGENRRRGATRGSPPHFRSPIPPLTMPRELSPERLTERLLLATARALSRLPLTI